MNRSFNTLFFALSLFVLVVAVYRAMVLPFCNDESITFFQFVQPGNFLPYTSILNTNNHFLNSLLTWICFHLFGDSALSLRLPNLMGLLILIIAVYRLSNRLTQTSSKAILVSGLLLSFYWISFFNMCRGYGISLAFTTLAISYIPDYLEDKRIVHVFKIYALLSLAVCANLTLIMAAAIITALICFHQLRQRQFFKVGNLIALIIHVAVLLFWIKYLFFLQNANHLHAGPGGGGYWKVTFVTLINTIAGNQNLWINISALAVYLLITALTCSFVTRNRKQMQSGQTMFVLFSVIALNGLIMGVYILKKLFGVSYPEDRTALVFYLLFILNAAFVMDTVKLKLLKVFATVWVLVFAVHFAWSLNFTKHPLFMYSTIPNRYYERLLQEQKQRPERITIGGNSFFEPIFAFMNYRNNGALNYMDYADTMLLNTDYYITVRSNRKYYAPLYEEIESDKGNDTVLLKRKQPFVRKPLFAFAKQGVKIDTGKEYFNFFEKKDTAFATNEPLLVEFNFKVTGGEMPAFSWLVLSVDSAEGKTVYYSRIPMNRMKRSWLGNESEGDLILETGVLPKKIHRLVCYLWNVGHQKLEVQVSSIKAFQLQEPGVVASSSNTGK
jgi:hypothetical protein